MTTTRPAATIAEQKAENEAKQKGFRARIGEINAARAENEAARGKQVAHENGSGATTLRREARDLQQERDDLTAALGHLTAEAGELEGAHQAAKREEADANLSAAKPDFDRELDAAAAALHAFYEREFRALIAKWTPEPVGCASVSGR